MNTRGRQPHCHWQCPSCRCCSLARSAAAPAAAAACRLLPLPRRQLHEDEPLPRDQPGHHQASQVLQPQQQRHLAGGHLLEPAAAGEGEGEGEGEGARRLSAARAAGAGCKITAAVQLQGIAHIQQRCEGKQGASRAARQAASSGRGTTRGAARPSPLVERHAAADGGQVDWRPARPLHQAAYQLAAHPAAAAGAGRWAGGSGVVAAAGLLEAGAPGKQVRCPHACQPLQRTPTGVRTQQPATPALPGASIPFLPPCPPAARSPLLWEHHEGGQLQRRAARQRLELADAHDAGAAVLEGGDAKRARGTETKAPGARPLPRETFRLLRHAPIQLVARHAHSRPRGSRK